MSEANAAVNEMTMSDLIAYYNTLADAAGVAQVDSFKSLAEGRDEVARLEAKALGIEPTAPAAAGVAPATDAQKYNTSGKRGPNQGIGAYSKERILAGKSNQEILAEIGEKFPGAKTTASCIAYYRSALKKGPAVADPAALKAKAAELVKQAEEIEAKQAADKAAAEAKAAEAPVPTPEENAPFEAPAEVTA